MGRAQRGFNHFTVREPEGLSVICNSCGWTLNALSGPGRLLDLAVSRIWRLCDPLGRGAAACDQQWPPLRSRPLGPLDDVQLLQRAVGVSGRKHPTAS